MRCRAGAMPASRLRYQTMQNLGQFGDSRRRWPAAREFPAAGCNCKAWPGLVVTEYSWAAGGQIGERKRQAHDRMRTLRRYERRDFERVAALIHDDIDWVIYTPMSVFPFAGPRRGARGDGRHRHDLCARKLQTGSHDRGWRARRADVGPELLAARHQPRPAAADWELPAATRRAPDRVPRIH
jgi:hypothetical protein